MKVYKIKYGLVLKEFGLALMFYNKRQANEIVKKLEQIDDLTKAKVIKFAHENHVMFSYLVK